LGLGAPSVQDLATVVAHSTPPFSRVCSPTVRKATYHHRKLDQSFLATLVFVMIVKPQFLGASQEKYT